MESLIAWLVVAMTAWAPMLAPARDAPRYQAIAGDFAAVAYDPSEAPLFAGTSGRAKTALQLAAVAAYESGGFNPAVDDGQLRGKLGEVCIMQVLIPKGMRIVLDSPTYSYSPSEGWAYEDLVADRRKCIRAGLHKIRESLKSCKNLSLYTAGPPCNPEEPKAKHRKDRAEGWWRHKPAPVGDDEVVL